MKNEFVTYDIALKLKELGFDENTLCAFETYMDNSYRLCMPANKHRYLEFYKKYSGKNLHLIKAPLWQQVEEWLIKEIGIHPDFNYTGQLDSMQEVRCKEINRHLDILLELKRLK